MFFRFLGACLRRLLLLPTMAAAADPGSGVAALEETRWTLARLVG